MFPFLVIISMLFEVEAKIIHVHGKVTGNAKGVYVSLHEHMELPHNLKLASQPFKGLAGKYDGHASENSLDICDSPTCAKKVKNIQTKPDKNHGGAETYEFWIDDSKVSWAWTYKLIFDCKNSKQQTKPVKFCELAHEGTWDKAGEQRCDHDVLVPDVNMKKI